LNFEQNHASICDKIHFSDNAYDALQDSDALAICTEWSIFRTPDFEEMTKRLKSKVIFDGRNLFEPTEMKELGYYYNSIGRQTIQANQH
jgi:UDPglucose 6-dehydrogenase